MKFAIPAVNVLKNWVARIPYRWIAGATCLVCGTDWYHRRFCAGDRESFLQLQQTISTKLDLRSALMLSSVRKALKTAAIRKVAHTPSGKLETLFPSIGFERVRQLLHEGRRIILLGSHFGGPRFFPLWIARNGIPVTSLEAKNIAEKIGVPISADLDVVVIDREFPARATILAGRALNEYRVCHILGDGYQGSHRIKLPFLGKERTFASGFAELAIANDAVVVPVFVPLDTCGVPTIEFLDPIDPGSELDPCEQRVSSMVRQYAALLEAHWKQSPGNIGGGHLRNWLQELLGRDGNRRNRRIRRRKEIGSGP